MTIPAENNLLSVEDYLAMEQAFEIRHERVGGEIFAMTGASRAHNLINGNVCAALHNQLKWHPSEIYSNAMRVKVSPVGDYVYPDIVVVCEPPQFEDENVDTLLNPTLIIEVLSDSTEAYDRGGKFAAYRNLDSLREYLLITQHDARLEHYIRQTSDSWLLTEVTGLQSKLELPGIGCQLTLDEVYTKVSLEP